jgi:hypothetical protein
MLAVAVQLPAAVVTNDRCGVTGRATEPEASAEAASAGNAQATNPTDVMRTAKPPLLAWMNEPTIGRKILRPPYKTLKRSRTLVRPSPSLRLRAFEAEAPRRACHSRRVRVAAIYDVHGNLPALTAVLAEVDALGVDSIVVGGDVASGPMPVETLDALRARGARFVRGNADRVLDLRGANDGETWVQARWWVAARLGEERLSRSSPRSRST